ncbi:hypothetical protein BKA57DRAFT_524167 [Linnemannia elongata]|nr:hypothetical protein BKA57DRAFT_524167 [Linnemannia elongata]
MHPHIPTILATAAACFLLLGSTHASPILPSPFSIFINNPNHKRSKSPSTHKPQSGLGSTHNNNQTYVPPYPNPGILAPLPSWFKWPPSDSLSVTPRYKPIYTTDELVDFIVDVPKGSVKTSVTLQFEGVGSTPFEATVRPGTNVVSVPKRSSLTSGSQPLLPFGMYAGFSNFGEVDPVGAMQELKAMVINHVNFVPPYGDGKQILACIKAAQDAGVSIQYDMRHTYINTTKVIAEVNSFKAYAGLATWYTADEPDGQSVAPEPKASIQAYRTIQSIDPHRLDPSSCNFSPEGGCCGCDGCFGDLGTDIRRRLQSYRSQLAEIGKPRTPIWMVLQAFSDPNTCWSRAPTPDEYRLMAYLSLIHGAKGLMGWIYPQGLTKELKASLPGLSAELVPLASRFILGGEQVLEYTDTKRQIAASVWRVDGGEGKLYIVVNSGDKAVTLTEVEVATIFGKDSALVESRRGMESLAVLILTTM